MFFPAIYKFEIRAKRKKMSTKLNLNFTTLYLALVFFFLNYQVQCKGYALLRQYLGQFPRQIKNLRFASQLQVRQR